MNEATCKRELVKILRQTLLQGRVFRHEDAFTGGIPDISLSNAGRTLWVEVKLDRPGRAGRLTVLQAASLRALRGVLLRYKVDKAGLLGATTAGYAAVWAIALPNRGEPCGVWTAPMLKNKAEVHRRVAAELLRLLNETTTCTCGAPLTTGRCSGNCERDE